jgi:GTP-binding protein
MTFLDEALVTFQSGRGGSGAVSFHREKFVPRGGPDGADGGKGGDVTLIADRGRRTLYDFRITSKYEAESGDHGVTNKRGKDGKGIEIRVPVGTIVFDAETNEILADMTMNGMRHVICKGGKGGKGNLHYASSVRQTPNFAQKGAPGERVYAKLELKLIADVGLVGLPNAGKSTLISRISSAKPKIADYPFTTIVPNLGVVKHHDTSFVVADTPGLIEGASEGVGLGHRFLKHVERNRVLVHVVDAFPSDGSDPVANYEIIERELKLYSEDIWARPRLIALNKVDLSPQGVFNDLRMRFEELGKPLFPISAVSGQGIDALLNTLVETLERETPAAPVPVLVPAGKSKNENDWGVEAVEDGFRVIGKRIEKMVAMTDLENDEALRHLHRRLTRIGVIEKLRDLGAVEGDNVSVGEIEFEFEDYE